MPIFANMATAVLENCEQEFKVPNVKAVLRWIDYLLDEESEQIFSDVKSEKLLVIAENLADELALSIVEDL